MLCTVIGPSKPESPFLWVFIRQGIDQPDPQLQRLGNAMRATDEEVRRLWRTNLPCRLSNSASQRAKCVKRTPNPRCAGIGLPLYCAVSAIDDQKLIMGLKMRTPVSDPAIENGTERWVGTDFGVEGVNQPPDHRIVYAKARRVPGHHGYQRACDLITG
jgi:hypothetical protein